MTRALKAPSLADAIPRLAERARAETWTHEDFLAACLQREVAAREAHGGEGRIRAARFPARKALEESSNSTINARSNASRSLTWARWTSSPLNRTSSSSAPRHRQDAPIHRVGHPRLPGRSSRRVRPQRCKGVPTQLGGFCACFGPGKQPPSVVPSGCIQFDRRGAVVEDQRESTNDAPARLLIASSSLALIASQS